MKIKLLLLSLVVFTGILSAQDTIFVKNGQVIPAIIVEKNNTEIKYKKFGQPASAAIYSVFVSDIKSIHFSDGIIADYTQAGQPATETGKEKPIEKAGTMNAIKWSFGASAEYFAVNPGDDLLEFWRYHTGDPNAEIGGNPLSFPFFFKMNMALGNMKRNWIGDELLVNIMPGDAIYATDDNGSNEISLGNIYSTIIIYYGRSLNHKNTLLAIIEPGLDISFSMTGTITINSTEYEETGTGMGYHIATGFDWLISKRFTASLRGGYRFMTIKEQHRSSTSSDGFANFYVNHSVSDELLSIKWNGPYVNFGLQWSFYTKMKSLAPPE
jgi:hypothetical protein